MAKLELNAYRAREEMATARRALQQPVADLGGLWGASLAFFLAAWKDPQVPPAGKGPCLVVTPTQEEADELAEELGIFTPLPVSMFPAWESLFLQDSEPEGEIYCQRLEVAARLCEETDEPSFVIAPVQAVLQPVPRAETLKASRLELKAGQDYSPQRLAHKLVSCGFRNVPLVEARGEFSVRGDILDFFPYQGEYPFRLEFFGDTLESLRHFRAETQRSVLDSERNAVDILLPAKKDLFLDCFRGPDDLLLPDLLGPYGRIFLKESQAVWDRADKILHNLLGEESSSTSEAFQQRLATLPLAGVSSLPVSGGAGGVNLSFVSVERYREGDITQVCELLSERLKAGYRVEVYCETPAEAKRFGEILEDHALHAAAELAVRTGPLRRGFEVAAIQAVFLTTRELFHRRTIRRIRKKRSVPSRAIQSFVELARGDYVVHLAHGVGRYLGMECIKKDGVLQEFLVIEFRNQVKLYVPVSKTDLVQRYIGPGDKGPTLDKLGGTSWSRKKEHVEAAVLDLASELLEVQAMRQEKPGFAFPADSEWQREFEAAFPFEDTQDQVEVTDAIKVDMRASRPMDRLICGDVGYGKTEVAMRATFKAVEAGKQVGILVPTTVLAQQHLHTFRERMAEFPVSIEVLSRFRTPSQQRKVLESARAGKVDILIGTHRLLSKDVDFRDLGLVIIDEEQRFGVAHKEKLKKLRRTVDVLTLSATPIPRTLHMALLGIRDISSLSTAPEGRNPVLTEIRQLEPKLVREAIIRELNRDGQVYFVHNRINDIELVKSQLEMWVPEARTEYAHGQMNEHQLEERMLRFIEGEIDVLVSTTIIESGIDIPNVNTIFIDEADIYGLADLHQLRGRVGRYKHQAYCYLLLPAHRHVNPDAQKRLQALVEFSDLGAGFQIALRDLEIRGAGNILGAQQSGHIALVGYDMYCRLLETAVRRLKEEKESEPVQVEVDLALEAFIPDQFLCPEKERLEIYRRISQATEEEFLTDLKAELKDRFGPIPVQLQRLFGVQRLRQLCAQRGVEYIGRDGQHLILRGGEPMKELLQTCPVRVVVLDGKTVAVPLADPRRHQSPLRDAEVFRAAMDWLSTGEFSPAWARPELSRRS